MRPSIAEIKTVKETAASNRSRAKPDWDRSTLKLIWGTQISPMAFGNIRRFLVICPSVSCCHLPANCSVHLQRTTYLVSTTGIAGLGTSAEHLYYYFFLSPFSSCMFYFAFGSSLYEFAVISFVLIPFWSLVSGRALASRAPDAKIRYSSSRSRSRSGSYRRRGDRHRRRWHRENELPYGKPLNRLFFCLPFVYVFVIFVPRHSSPSHC